MAFVTFQVLDGLEAGRTFADMETPVTIGREEDCHIRLNDDRVSRLHARIQEDSGRVILTDVDSTNGTRINGHPVKIRVLQAGDQIVIGRSTLIFGNLDEIDSSAVRATISKHSEEEDGTDRRANAFLATPGDPPPELPSGLNTLQAAQISDILNYLQVHLLFTLDSGQEQNPSQDRSSTELQMLLPAEAWHSLQRMQLQLSAYLKRIADPG